MTYPLVTVADLAGHLGDPNWVVFDCRFDLGDPAAGHLAYLAGHIPGAHYADLDRHLAGLKNGSNGRHPLPEIDAFARFLQDHGVSHDTLVVAYDARDSMYAARLWWLLQWVGHAHVAVLDGGLKAWQDAGLTLDQHVSAVATRGELTPLAPLVGTVSLEQVMAGDEMVLIDARAAARYRGEVEPLDRVPGHIPGALNRPYTSNLDTDGKFLPPAELRRAFLELLGSNPAETVVHQCGSGVTACHNALAMTLANLPGARLYPGSYSQWSADPDRAIATGPDP